MTLLRTAPPVTVARLISPATGSQFQLTCNICPDSHRTQVWLCFLVLSFLTLSASATSWVEIKDVMPCLKGLKPSIQNSDAMLYAPSMDDIIDIEQCADLLLKCYMLELIMVIDEEGIEDNNTNCIKNFNASLTLAENPGRCPPCEAYSLRNITIFGSNLINLLEAMSALNAKASET